MLEIVSVFYWTMWLFGLVYLWLRPGDFYAGERSTDMALLTMWWSIGYFLLAVGVFVGSIG